jgi:hypothetical protein
MGATVVEAADAANVSERTVYRRLHDSEFREQLLAGRDELLCRTTGELVEASTEAVATLRDLLSPQSPAAQRLGAARAILDLSMRLREAGELAERVARLEHALGLNTKGATNGKP